MIVVFVCVRAAMHMHKLFYVRMQLVSIRGFVSWLSRSEKPIFEMVE